MRRSLMQRKYVPQSLFALLAAAILALPLSAAPASAAPAPAQLDDSVGKLLTTAPSTALIPVIVEGAVQPSAVATDPAQRQQRVESRVRSTGGHVVGGSALLGASVAELTPA